MLEFPEISVIARQLQRETVGKMVTGVLPPVKPHRFCWFNGDPAGYEARIKGSRITGAEGFGIYVELAFDNGLRLCFNDGVNVRLMEGKKPAAYQLLIRLDDGRALAFTVAMYGGLILHDDGYDDEYYRKSRAAADPLSKVFAGRYWMALEAANPKLSAKAFLATEQRFPGLGNGVLQDILFRAKIHPRRKLESMSGEEKAGLLAAAAAVLGEMEAAGGRDTEKDIYGNPGQYRTIMSKSGLKSGCPACGGAIAKAAYLGGSVYYCPRCQPEETAPQGAAGIKERV